MPTVSHFRIFQFRIVTTAVVWALLGIPAHAASPVIAFDIAAQPMAGALQALAEQADVQILFTVSDVNAFTAPPVTGRMSSEDALKRLLDGTTLECVRNGDVLVIRERAVTKTEALGGEGTGSGLRLAQLAENPATGENPPTPAGTRSPPAPSTPASTAESDATPLGETVVTGSLIRGTSPASPLIVLDRDAIAATGYSTVQQVIQSLPQNYGGGDAEGTSQSPGGSGMNVGRGAAVNLRGLGTDSTLVLLNGHRLAPTAFGQFVDISMIPLSAVERIDVLTDGASATYGSDAVAGVVNFVLSDHYSGAETLFKGGTVTEGHLDEYQFSQTLGGDWERGNALVTYEYFKRGNLDANERDFSRPALDPFDLLAEQERHSVLVSGGFDLSQRTTLSATGLYSQRDTFYRAANTATRVPTLQPASTELVSANLSLAVDLSDSWVADLSVLQSRTELVRDLITPTSTTRVEQTRHDVQSVEARADGPVVTWPGGTVRLALGAAYREEAIDEREEGGLDTARSVNAAFAELRVPLGDDLTLSLAGRYEDYSDIGDTVDPKFGFAWSPLEGVTFRGTYGTSFRAPIFSEVDEYNVTPVLLDLPDATASDGQTLTLFLSGNNPELKPEQATTWTLGLDLTSVLAPDTQLSLTYFDIEFDDKITQPLPSSQLFTLFSQEAIYASLLTRDPDDAFVAQLIADPEFQNGFGPFVPSDVEAFFDRRLQNFSATNLRGIDLAVTQGLTLGASKLTFSASGTYLLDYTEAVARGAPVVDFLNTIYHQVDLKLRAAAQWTLGRWHTALFVNYIDNYTDITVTPTRAIDSWTTLDLILAYDVPLLDATRLSLSASNLLDEAPPAVSSPLPNFRIGFDPTNASGLGRFVSLALTTRW